MYIKYRIYCKMLNDISTLQYFITPTLYKIFFYLLNKIAIVEVENFIQHSNHTYSKIKTFILTSRKQFKIYKRYA